MAVIGRDVKQIITKDAGAVILDHLLVKGDQADQHSVVLATDGSTDIIGVSSKTDDGTSNTDDKMPVAVSGIELVKAGAVVNAYTKAIGTTGGKAINLAGTDAICYAGLFLNDGNTDDLVPLLINPGTFSNA